MIKINTPMHFIVMLCIGLLSFSSKVMAVENGSQHSHTPSNRCGSHNPSEEWEKTFQKKLLEARNEMMVRRGNEKFVIPVIVHIIHTGQSVGTGNNVPATRVQSQIEVLNRDFAGIGTGVSGVPNLFRNLVANTGIEFCLATRNPQGQLLAEPGIERIRAQSKGWALPGSSGYSQEYVSEVIKPGSFWDPSLYLNIWVCPLRNDSEGALLGYATFPNFTGLTGIPSFWETDNKDGVVISTNAFGTVPQAGLFVGFNQGRTTTHEIGHWLGLRHIWGDGDCSVDDFVADTPNQNEESDGCPTFPKRSCGNSGNMSMNFMDYSDDVCAYMFSKGQAERMLTTMQKSPLRKALAESPMCSTNPLVPIVRIDAEQKIVCPQTAVQFLDKSRFTPTSWSWTFEGGTPATSSEKNPTVTFANPGLYKVTLTATNGEGSATDSIFFRVRSVLSIPYAQDFEGGSDVYPPAEWSLVTRNSEGKGWELFNEASAFGVGNNCIYFDNTNLDVVGALDDIVSPMFNLTTAREPALIYDFAHAPYIDIVEADDELQILASTDCGTSFTSLFREKGSKIATAPPIGEDWMPMPNEWRTDTLRLTQFAGQNKVMINIRNINDYGHSFYIDNVKVIDIAPQVPPNIVSITPSLTKACQGSSITYTASAFGTENNYTWTLTGSNQTPIVTQSNQVTVVYNNAGNFNVRLIATNEFGVDTLIVNNIVEIGSPINVSVTNPAAPVCGGTPVVLTASGADSYIWSNGSIGNTITVNPLATTNYWVKGTSLLGCTDTAFTSVNVDPTLGPQIEITEASGCVGEKVTVTASGAESYVWSNGINDATAEVIVSNEEVVSVIGTTSGCSSQVKADITALATPSKPTITRNNEQLSSSSAVNNVWYKDVVELTGFNAQTLELTGKGVYQLEVKNPETGCSAFSDSVVVFTTSVLNQLKGVNLKLYPNPSGGNFNLELESKSSARLVLTLSNIAGQQLRSEIIQIPSGRTILPYDAGKVSDGMYFLQIANENGNAVVPFAIQR